MASTGTTGNKHKHAARNNGEARKRYWASKRLQEHKVRHLRRQEPFKSMKVQAVIDYWREQRGNRRMKVA